MTDVDNAPKPLPSQPEDFALRLRGYITGLESWATRHTAPGPGTGKTKDIHILGGDAKRLLTHIRRTEHQLRCFILMLAATLIRLSNVAPTPPAPLRRPPEPARLAEKQDRELREQLSGRPRISGFQVTTPVIKGKGRRKSRRQSRYRMLPDPLRPVDAGYLLARMARLPRVLARADKMAARLAARAMRVRDAAPPGTTGYLSQPLPGTYDVPRLSGLPQAQAPTHPLYLEPLQHWLPPADLWESTEDEAERQDLNVLHYLASARLDEAGFAIRPDPHKGLPDLAAFTPPEPPQIRTI